MLKLLFGKIKFNLSQTSIQKFDEVRRFRHPVKPNIQQEANAAGIRTDYPIIVDPLNPHADGKVPVKGQITHGKGDPQNPSQELDPQKDLKGDSKPQHVVHPKKPMTVDFKDLHPPISGSDNYMDQKKVKDNLNKSPENPQITNPEINILKRFMLSRLFTAKKAEQFLTLFEKQQLTKASLALVKIITKPQIVNELKESLIRKIATSKMVEETQEYLENSHASTIIKTNFLAAISSHIQYPVNELEKYITNPKIAFNEVAKNSVAPVRALVEMPLIKSFTNRFNAFIEKVELTNDQISIANRSQNPNRDVIITYKTSESFLIKDMDIKTGNLKLADQQMVRAKLLHIEQYLHENKLEVLLKSHQIIENILMEINILPGFIKTPTFINIHRLQDTLLNPDEMKFLEHMANLAHPKILNEESFMTDYLIESLKLYRQMFDKDTFYNIKPLVKTYPWIKRGLGQLIPQDFYT